LLKKNAVFMRLVAFRKRLIIIILGGEVLGKRQIAALQTRKNVIAAADKLISEKGFENVTISDIAAEAGVAIGTFYTYFKRKEDVVGEIAYSNFAAMQEKSRLSDGDVTDKITSFLTDSMRYIVDTGLRIAQQWVKNVVEPQEEDGKKKLLYDFGVIKEILEDAVSKGELSKDMPIDWIHQWIVAEYYGIVSCWCIMDGAIEPTELLEGFCRTMLKNSLACYVQLKSEIPGEKR
jgi:AcrR family transcriptional regulator